MASKRYFDEALGAEPQGYSNGDVSMTERSPSANNKGKGKEPQVQTTLFVSSLPFTATSTDLSTLFSDIGPLKRAFVVTDKESGKSKGVGFVTFAILEDAQRAERELQGKSLDGKRKMRIEWAEKKAFGGRKKVKVDNGENVDETVDLVMHDDSEAVVEAPKVTGKPSTSRRIAPTFTPDQKDKDAVRTIVMTGLAACKPAADEKTLYKRTRKIGDVESVVYPAPLSIMSTSTSDDVAYVVYRTPNHAMTAVEKLHAHTFKGAQISVVLKKRADGVAKLDSRMRPETKEKKERLQKKIEEEREQIRIARELVRDQPVKGADVNRGSRLIVRNLPFDVTDKDLRAVFLPYGPVYSIDVPQKVATAGAAAEEEDDVSEDAEVDSGSASSSEEKGEDDDDDDESDEEDDEGDESATAAPTQSSDAAATTPSKPSKGRGFAFVWMVSRNDATNAIKNVNGNTIGRGAAEKAQVRSAKGKAGRDAAKKALEEVLKTAKPGRPVAVDWALSKKEWESKKDESEAEDTDKEASDGENEDEDEDSDLDPVEADEDKGSDEEDEDEEEEKKPSLPAPSEMTTLFIRNLPYQTTEVELRDVFRAFGPLRYAKVTMDKATNKPKGTGFVCFWQKESADKALKQAQLVEREGGAGTSLLGQQNPFSAPSVLTADPSAPMTASLHLHGRVLAVTLAVERETAENMSNKNRSARDKKDKRNTYLMREGVPLPGTPLASIMSEKEKEKRLSNFSIRKTQLTKNPSLFISKTRLSIRQLPLFVSHKMLKRLGIYAAREFDAQVKRGERPDLSAEEKEESKELMEEMHLNRSSSTSSRSSGRRDVNMDDGKGEVSNKQFKKFVGERSTAVIQSKVMLQNDRIDAITGLGRSRGYGFLEMRSFADALKVVRFVNGDKSLSKMMIKWYADELESMVKGLTRDVEQGGASSSVKGGGKEDEEERQSRLKRVEKKFAMVKEGRVDADEDGGRGGSIMAEFSIENIVVTKKRKERASHSQNAAANNKRKRSSKDDDDAINVTTSRPASSMSSSSRGGGRGGNNASSSFRGQPRERGGDQSASFKRARVEPKRPVRRENWNQKTTKGPGKSANAIEIKQPRKIGGDVAGAPASPAATPKVGQQVGGLIGRKRKERKGRK